MQPHDFVIMPVANMDDDDLDDIVDNLEFKDNVLVICKSGSMRNKRVHFIQDSFRDVNRILAKIHAWKQKNCKHFAGVVALDEEYHYSFSEAIAKEFGLCFYNRDLLDLASNKYLQRLKLSEMGIKVPDFRLINRTAPLSGIGYPNVLKIITGYGSSFVYINHNEKELSGNLRRIASCAKAGSYSYMFRQHPVRLNGEQAILDPRTQFILEEYVPGNEYSCDFMVHEGEVHVLRVVKKVEDKSHFAMFDAFMLFNPDEMPDSEFSLNYLQSFCKKVANGLGIERGVCMMDFKFSNEIVVLEITIRPGISTFVALMAQLYGFTSINKLVRQHFGLPIEFTIPKENGMVVYMTSPNYGTLTSLDTTGLERHRQHLGITRIRKYHKIGQRILHNRCNSVNLVLGYILFEHVDLHKADDFIAQVSNHVRIQVKA
jgi:hypothetical protein